MATISGKWKFKDNITFENDSITVNFTSNGQSFTNINFLPSGDAYYVIYSHVVAGEVVGTQAVYNNGIWTEEYQTVDFGEEQSIADTSLDLMKELADEVSEEIEDPEEPEEPEEPEDPEDSEIYYISGTYTFAENASCSTVDQRVNFMYDDDGYSAVRSGTNADGDPVTYFDWEDGGSRKVQCMGAWEIDTTKSIDFGTTPQAVSAEFLTWVNSSLVSEEKATISGKWTFRNYITFESYDIDVNFTSNGQSFQRMTFVRTDINLDYSYEVRYTALNANGELIHEESVYPDVDASEGWVEAAYQIVDFGEEPQEIPASFLALMAKTAIKDGSVQTSNYGFKRDSSFICPIFDPIKFIDDNLRSLVKFYVRLSDVSEEVIE